MRFLIERWAFESGEYEPAVAGEGGSGDQAIARAFDDAGIETVGCYRVRPEGAPDERPAYYVLTIGGNLVPQDRPCQ